MLSESNKFISNIELLENSKILSSLRVQTIGHLQYARGKIGAVENEVFFSLVQGKLVTV